MPSNQSISAAYDLEEFGLQNVGPAIVEAWADLESRAIEPNAYLSPHFVLPALRHLDPELKPLFIAVYAPGQSGRMLVGFGVFVTRPRTWRAPLRRLSAYRSKMSYLTGLLVDRACVDPVVSRFLEYISGKAVSWDCIEFQHSRLEGALMLAVKRQAAIARITVHLRNEYQRAVLVPEAAGPAYFNDTAGGKRIKELRRQRRKLGEQGALSWRLLVGSDADCSSALERFLTLENMGWKGTKGTSLLAQPLGQAFAKELGERFGKAGRLFFTELLLDGVPIASTCNLLAGNMGFAFKIGWNPAYGRFSPGMLNELHLVEEAANLLTGLAEIDSGAAEGSFIDVLWVTRQPMATMLLPTTRVARILLASRHTLRLIRSAFR
jgi:CelD/BcsL family acetyltransferase involved in cellulose biosynthesis